MTQTPPAIDPQHLRDTGAPPLQRGHMPSKPWLGWRHGLGLALRHRSLLLPTDQVRMPVTRGA